MKPPNPLILLVAAAVLFGGMFPVNRLAAEAGWPAFAFAFAPALIAGILTLGIGAVTRTGLSLSRQALIADVVIGGLVIAMPIGILVNAAQHLPASTLTLVLCLSPILTLLIAAATGSESFSGRVLFGMVLGTLGIALIVWPSSGVLAEGDSVWFLIALIAPVGFALANNCAAWLRPPAAPSISMATGTLLGGAVVAAVLALVLQEPLWPDETGAVQLLPLALASIINAGFYFLFFWLVNAIGPARFSIFNYLAVAAGIVWSMVFFHELPAPVFWIAALLMLFGMHLALRPDRAARG